MKELISYLARSLANHPEEVAVAEIPGDNGVTLELNVAGDDLNHLIGKQGRTIRAMRALLSAASAKSGRRYFLKIASGSTQAEEPEPQETAEADNEAQGL